MNAPGAPTFVTLIGQALLLAAGMIWRVAWSLVLGLTLSGLVQTLVSKQRMREVLGRDGLLAFDLWRLAAAHPLEHRHHDR